MKNISILLCNVCVDWHSVMLHPWLQPVENVTVVFSHFGNKYDVIEAGTHLLSSYCWYWNKDVGKQLFDEKWPT